MGISCRVFLSSYQAPSNMPLEFKTMVGRERKPPGRMCNTAETYNKYYKPEEFTIKCEGGRHGLPSIDTHLNSTHFFQQGGHEVCTLILMEAHTCVMNHV